MSIGRDFHQPTHRTSVQHTDHANESVQQQILIIDNISPISHGDIQEEFRTALNLSFTTRRPLLIQFYHQRKLDVLDLELFQEFLTVNYIVWSRNISHLNDRRQLNTLWGEHFPQELAIDFVQSRNPMLIGMMKSFTVSNDTLWEYVPEILLIDDVLPHANEQFDVDSLFNELIDFKEEFDENHRYLWSDFVRKIASCNEFVLQISEYLSLNDAVATFSLGVLPCLWNYNRKLPVIDPSGEFLCLMTKRNQLDKIIGLHIQSDHFEKLMKSISTNTFLDTQSVQLKEIHGRGNMPDIDAYFPQITFILLSYNEKVRCHKLCQIFNVIPSSINCLTVRCPAIQCPHYDGKYLFVRVNDWNYSVQTFTFYINLTSSLINKCHMNHSHCALNTILQFLEIMKNVQDIRIITESNMETLLNLNEWTNFFQNSPTQLNRIKLQGKKSPVFNEQSFDALQQIRPSINFQFSFS